MRDIRGSAVLILVILFASFVSASFSAGTNDGIDSFYGPGETIRGWVNISFDKEAATSLFESSLGGTIQLIDLIKKPKNSAFIYNCNPATCESNYLTSNGDIAKTFNLQEGETTLFGMKITAKKKVGEISDFYFNLSSNNPETEKMPLRIDLLDDGQMEWQAYSASAEFGDEKFGCYIGVDTETQLIASVPQYCEKINLPKTPGVEIGAYVAYEKGTGNVGLEMSIERSDGSESIKTCTATVSGTGVKRIACPVTGFSVNEAGDYYVCIKTKLAADNGKYKINSEQTSPCGFTGDYGGSYDYDFEIFARPKTYASSIKMIFDNAELSKAKSPILNAEDYIDEYITEHYKNNCSSGCIIPIKIYSGISQQIDVSNFFMSYIADTYTENTDVFDVEETPAEISSSSQKLFLDDSNFSVPSSYGNHTFSLKLNDAEVISKKISVGEVAQIKSVTPTRTAAKYPTTFKAETTGKNITGYTWNFGDGGTISTTTNTAEHTYNAMGAYTLKITINSAKGSASKNFNITVGSASEIVPSLLDEASLNIDNIRSQMETFSQFEKDSIGKTLNLDGVEATVDGLKSSLSAVSSEADYESALAELLSMNLPTAIAKTVTSEGIVFYPAASNVNLEALKEIGGGDYTIGKDDQYKESVLGWYNSNIENDLKYSEISLIYEGSEKPLRIFEMHIKKNGADNAYIMINSMENLFLENEEEYSEKSGYFYTDLDGTKDISFSTTAEVDFVNVPMFISPSLSNLVILEITPPAKINWTLPIVLAIVIVLIAIVVWVILQIWYTRKYESYLFKDRNQLYNLVNYIGDAKKKGEKDNEISEKLKKSGWNAEQLRYALRKYDRKNTGLPEIIPIGKILEEMKKIMSKKVPLKTPTTAK